MITFEWDEEKSSENRKKHGINFETARNLWLDEERIEIYAPHPVENRKIMIARLKGKMWTAVFTRRSESVRIISVRRAREKEVKMYEEKTG